MDRNWYKKLNKSPLTPPVITFKIVWPILYFMILTSLSMVVFAKENVYKQIAYFVFIIQILLNFSWPIVFFDFKKPKVALLVLILLLFVILINILLFLKISVLSGVLLIPYFIWCLFAFYLNFEIIRLN